MTAPDKPSDVEQAVAEYLQSGGLFNPEHMEHSKVRDLLMAIRTALDAREKEGA